MDYGHWTLAEGVELNEDTFGFIYLVTNKKDGRRYIGKKQCIFALKRKPLKGKKRCRRDVKESNWKKYTGSCKKLNEDIKQFGMENFTFSIIKACCSKSQLMYEEAKMLFDYNVLFSKEYYNDNIHCRLHRVKIDDGQ